MSRYLKVGVETEFGTGTADTPVRVLSFDLNPKHNMVYIETVENILPSDAVYGTLGVSGSIEVPVIPSQVIPILEAVMGSVTATDTNGDSVNDNFVFSLDAPKSLTVEYGDETNHALTLSGVIPSKISISFDPKDIVKMSVDYIAKTYADATYDYPVYNTDKPVVTWNTSLKIGGTVYKAKSVEVNIDRGINEDAYVVGDRTIDAIEYGITEVSGSITLTGTDLTEFKRALYGSTTATSPQSSPTEVSIEILATAVDGKYMKMTIPAVVYDSPKLSVKGRDPLEKSFEWRLIDSAFTIEISTL